MDEDPPARRVAERIGASRGELVGLAVVAVAAVVVVLVLWWWQRPTIIPASGTTAGGPVLDGPAGPVADGPSAEGVTLYVHVTGEVRRPGVVRLAAGSRVVDALESAGGATADADLSALNLARTLVDGEQVLVPTRGGDPATPGVGAAPASAWDPTGRLDLNLATADDLEQLPGIGPVLARRILEHRERTGRFASVGDLRAVEGIGEKTFQRLAELVVV